MDDKEKTITEAKTEDAINNTSEGLQSETENQFDRATKIVKELKEQIDRKEKLVEREEKLAIQNQLAGKGQAGTPQPAPIDKEKQAAQERINAVGRATGARWATSKEIENLK